MAHLPYEFTATFTNGSANVTAASAAFVTNLAIGDPVRGPDEKIYGVQTIGPLQTQFTLDRPYLGTTTTAAAKAFRHSEAWGLVSDINARLARIDESQQRGYVMQSASSLAIGAGTKVFTGVESGLNILDGIRLRATSRANAANFMEGTCTYSGSTLTMTVAAGDTGGSGTFADWNINICGRKGDTGATGGPAAPMTRQIFTSSGTWTKPTGCKTIRVYVVGGGGAGGGATGGSSLCGLGSGGSAGGVSEKLIDVTAISTVAVTVGDPGAGAPGGLGTAGTASVFTGHCSANGGGGGSFIAAGSSVLFVASSVGGSSASGDINFNGASGFNCLRLSGVSGLSGAGAASRFGGGGGGRTSQGDGVPATGYGSGGGGAASFNATGQTGGAGRPGVVIVEEFY